MKNINKKIGLVAITCILGLGIGSGIGLLMYSKQSNAQENEAVSSPHETMDNEIEQSRLINQTLLIMGGEYVKNAAIKNNKIQIDFVKNFNEFKEMVDETSITEEQYRWFWEDDDRIQTVLMREPLYLLREFPNLKGIKMTIPYDKYKYIINMTRNDIEGFFDLKFAELDADEDWETKYIQKVYDTKLRDQFSEKYIKKKKID